MPVRLLYDEVMSHRTDYLLDDAFVAEPPISAPLLSDDIWKKFELEFPELSSFDVLSDSVSVKSESSFESFGDEEAEEVCEIRNHDCMWAGHCASKEHDDPRQHTTSCFVSPAPPPAILKPPSMPLVASTAAVKKDQQPAASAAAAACVAPRGQQSLLKPAVRAAASATPLAHIPQTPPMSDDEEVKTKPTQVLQILNEAIRDCDFDEDSDLCEYFEEDEEVDVNVESLDEPQKEEKPNVTSFKYAAENDHSYHKGKMENLGIDTPSDSEEEIDVVSVDKLNYTKVFNLPNNPSTRDRQHIQRRVATAISNNRTASHNTGIKTILPVRKGGISSYSTPESTTPVKRRNVTDYRGTKRSRQYRNGTNSPYKKRLYGNSSDSEPEPSEKRSLHNNMERQRRIDLRNAFEDLRVLVPEVSKKEKAPKVVILREAAQYCDILTKTSYNYNKHMEDLKRHQDYLRRRVSLLRKSLAAKR